MKVGFFLLKGRFLVGIFIKTGMYLVGFQDFEVGLKTLAHCNTFSPGMGGVEFGPGMGGCRKILSVFALLVIQIIDIK